MIVASQQTLSTACGSFKRHKPRIGYRHAYGPDRPAPVLNIMERLRPLVDGTIPTFAQSHVFHPVDFAIWSGRACRINPELARSIVPLIAAKHESLDYGNI